VSFTKILESPLDPPVLHVSQGIRFASVWYGQASVKIKFNFVSLVLKTTLLPVPPSTFLLLKRGN